MEADHRRLDARVREQLGGAAGILGGNHARFTQHPQRAHGDVLQVADGGRHDVQTSGRRPGEHGRYCTLGDWATAAHRPPSLVRASACDLLKPSLTLRLTTWPGGTRCNPPLPPSTASMSTTTCSKTSAGPRSTARCAT